MSVRAALLVLRWRPLALILALLVAPAPLWAADGAPRCGGLEDPCPVAEGSYHLAWPEGWDGRTPLPAMVFLHGWRSSGAAYLRNSGFVEAWRRGGVLLVLPNGADNTWAHVGSPSDARDALAFLDRVVADLRQRHPISSLWASGFSQGSSMAWDLACYRGEIYNGIFALAGGFWEPLPARCAGPIRLLHAHGTDDGVVPMAGRPIGGGRWQQGDVRAGFEILKQAAACPAEADARGRFGPAECAVWTGCAQGRLALCLFEGGHRTPSGWIAEALTVIHEGWPDP